MAGEAVCFGRRASPEIACPQGWCCALGAGEGADLECACKIDRLIKKPRAFLARIKKDVGAKLEFVAVFEYVCERGTCGVVSEELRGNGGEIGATLEGR